MDSTSAATATAAGPAEVGCFTVRKLAGLGFGMKITAAGVVRQYDRLPAANGGTPGPAEAVGLPLGGRIVGVNGAAVADKESIVAALGGLADKVAAVTFAVRP